MLLFVLTVTLAIVMILAHVFIANFFSNFVDPITLTIVALTQILIPPLLLEKNFLFDVGFNYMIIIIIITQLMLIIFFLVNVPKEVELRFNKAGVTFLQFFSFNSIIFFWKKRGYDERTQNLPRTVDKKLYY